MAAIKAPSASSSSAAVQPLVRNSPNFTKYDGKCDHSAVNQFIHQFVAHFPLAKIKDPQDKVHLAAPHLTGEAVPWWQHWAAQHTDPLTHSPHYDWDTFVSDFKQRFLPPQYLTALEDEFADHKQKGMPVLNYSNKLLTLAQQIGATEKEKLRTFTRGLDASVKYAIRNLNPKTYEEALALAQNKELELNGGKPKQVAGGNSSQTNQGKGQNNKDKNGAGKSNTNNKPKLTPDEKAKAGVLGGFLTPEEQKAYMAEQRCFGCHVKGHRKQDCTKWKEKQKASTSSAAASTSDPTPPAAAGTTSSVVHQVPSLRQPQVVFEDKQEGASTTQGLLRAYGSSQGHQFTILFDTGSTEDILSPQLAAKLQCRLQPFVLNVDGFTPGIRTQITEKAVQVQFNIQSAVFERDFLVTPLTGCDMILGNPWFSTHAPLLDTKKAMFFISEGVPTPVTITGDRSIAGIPLISHLQARRAIRKGAECALLYVRVSSVHPAVLNSKQVGSIHGSDTAVSHSDQESRMKALLDQYQHLMLRDGLPPQLPPSRPEDHRIELVPGATPPSQFPYRLSKALEGELESQISDLLRAGFIRPSSSPFAAPVLFVLKKDKSARLCVDYRALNKLTIKNKFPMPRIEYILERLDGAKYFTKIDLKSGYHQVRIFEADIPKTAFRTERGHYEFVVIPFGLTGAPGSFNKTMSRAFAILIGKCVFIFLDDILVFSASYEQHLIDVEKVFRILEENQFYANSKKSTFGVQEVSYLGFIISSNGIRLDPEKIQAILDWEIPQTAQQIRSFVGLCQAYSRHMQNFSEVAAPLTDLLKGCKTKKQKVTVAGKSLEAFHALQKLASEAPVLKIASWDEPFEVITDASNIAVGAVLEQATRPIAFYSKKLDSAQRNYSVYDKELYAIITALKHWKHFLYGREFTVKTDHQALKWLQTMPSADWSDRQSRWSQLFQQFGGMIEYLPGKHNPVADALSRKSGTVQSAQRTTVLDSSALDSMKEDYLDSAEFGTPYSLAMAGEPGHFSLQDGWLLYKGRLCITASHRAALLHDAHDSLVGGHRGINNTLEKLERSFYWPKLRKDVYNYVQKCQVCQKVKSSHQKPAGLLRPLPIPEGPFQDISMDFVGPLPASHPSRNTMCFTIVDRFSKFVMLIPCKHTSSAEDVARLFIRFWYPIAGLPKTITSDRDAKFTSQFWRSLFDNFGTRLQFSSAFHPQTDGQTEIYNQLAFDVLKAYCHDQQNRWEHHLPLVQAILNDTHSSSIGRTPYEAAFGKRFSSLLTRMVSPSIEANHVVESYQRLWSQSRIGLPKHKRPTLVRPTNLDEKCITKQGIGYISG